MFTALTALLARLNPAARKAGALVLAAALLLSLGTWGWRGWQRHRLANEQAQATQAAARERSEASRRYRTYQLDSTRRAAERRQLIENARTQHQRNEALLHYRPQLIDLPERPPRP